MILNGALGGFPVAVPVSGGHVMIALIHHHYVPSVVNRSAVMDLHRSRSCATLIALITIM